MTGDPEKDELVNTDPTALLIAMLLDQQVPLEWAFAGPTRLVERLGHLDPTRLAGMDPDDLVAVASERPAIHRFPAAMARRIQQLMQHLVDEYQADPTGLWADGDGDQIRARLDRLPGFGAEKSMITMAVLAKRFGIRPPGWAEAAGVFSDDEPRSAADIFDADSHARVRDWKKRQRAAGLSKQDQPAKR